MSDQIWWYATRGAGLMTWAVAATAMVVGLVMAGRLAGRRPGFPWLLDLHRFLSGLTFVFLALHLVTLWADSFVEFGWLELFVPFTSSWRPTAVAWGIGAMYLMAAVQATSLVKDRLPNRVWHGIHLLSYPTTVFGTVHAWQSGSDVENPLVLAAGLALLALIVGLTVVRLFALRYGPAVRPTTADDRAAMLQRARERADRGAEADPEPAIVGLAARWHEAVTKG